MSGKRVYFASDFHLGIDTIYSSLVREKLICQWMDEIKGTAEALYILGDIFDFWFEHNQVIPKGYIRFQGKLAEWADSGIPVIIFRGNHDMWMFDYFKTELGISVISGPLIKKIKNHQFFLAHGDGLGPGDHGYKMLKKIFANKLCQWLFARLHPNLSMRIAKYWSGKSRIQHKENEVQDIEKEWLYIFANEELDTREIDFFIFGHRHIPMSVILKNDRSKYVNLGDWMYHFTYAEYDGTHVLLKQYKHP